MDDGLFSDCLLERRTEVGAMSDRHEQAIEAAAHAIAGSNYSASPACWKSVARIGRDAYEQALAKQPIADEDRKWTLHGPNEFTAHGDYGYPFGEGIDVVPEARALKAERERDEALDRDELAKRLVAERDRREGVQAADAQSADEGRGSLRVAETCIEVPSERIREMYRELGPLAAVSNALTADGPGSNSHRVRLLIEDGYMTLKLIHPEAGCQPALNCVCGRAFDESGPGCYDCKDQQPAGCWLTGWFDNCSAEDLLHGRIEIVVPITAEWDGDSCIAQVSGPPEIESPA